MVKLHSKRRGESPTTNITLLQNVDLFTDEIWWCGGWLGGEGSLAVAAVEGDGGGGV